MLAICLPFYLLMGNLITRIVLHTYAIMIILKSYFQVHILTDCGWYNIGLMHVFMIFIYVLSSHEFMWEFTWLFMHSLQELSNFCLCCGGIRLNKIWGWLLLFSWVIHLIRSNLFIKITNNVQVFMVNVELFGNNFFFTGL
jgi:hypothetical protein